MKKIIDIEAAVKRRFPDAQTSVSEPAREDGVWYLNVVHGEFGLAVSWSARKSLFGLVAETSDPKQMFPHEVYEEANDVTNRVFDLVASKGSTQPQLAAILRLREIAGLSQAEVARRMNIAQPTLAGIERRIPTGDVKLSTVMDMLASLGASLSVAIGDAVVKIATTTRGTPMKESKPLKIGRNAGTGQFITVKKAQKDKKGSVVETLKKRGTAKA